MQWLHDGQDVALDVDRWTLDEFAAQIGRAIGCLRESLGDQVGDERSVRAWISRLEPSTRASVLATVLSEEWPRGSESILAAIRSDRRSQCA